MNEPDRSPRHCVGTGAAVVMFCDAEGEIVGVAGVQGVVAAAKDVYAVHSAMIASPRSAGVYRPSVFVAFCQWVAMSAPCDSPKEATVTGLAMSERKGSVKLDTVPFGSLMRLELAQGILPVSGSP